MAAGAGGLLFFGPLLMILFRQKYPRWWFDLNRELLRFTNRVGIYLGLMDDRYPSTDEDQSVHLDIDYPVVPRDLNRWLPLIKWLLAIPHYVVLLFLYVAVFAVVVMVWLAILFTGRYPRSLFDFVEGVLRWHNRVLGYAFLLVTDRYDRFRTLIYSAAYTGMRWGELAALNVSRLNLLKGTVDIMESLAEINGHFFLQGTKTGARRSLSLPRFLAEMLGEHIGRFSGVDGHVFTAPEGGPLRRTFIRRHFKPAVAAAGLDPKFRFHDLRHTCASLLIAQGAHPKEIQERLGHSTIRLTFDRYGHLFPSLDERLREGLDQMFRSAKFYSR